MVTGNLGKRNHSGFNVVTYFNQNSIKGVPMKKIILLLIIMNIGFAQEFKVDGNLKVTGKIDAQNQPITNVAAPVDLDDAVNARVLQSTLADSGPYEYKLIYLTITTQNPNTSGQTSVTGYFVLDEDGGMVGGDLKFGATSYINQISQEGWSWFIVHNDIAVFRRLLTN